MQCSAMWLGWQRWGDRTAHRDPGESVCGRGPPGCEQGVQVVHPTLKAALKVSAKRAEGPSRRGANRPRSDLSLESASKPDSDLRMLKLIIETGPPKKCKVQGCQNGDCPRDVRCTGSIPASTFGEHCVSRWPPPRRFDLHHAMTTLPVSLVETDRSAGPG